MATTVLRKSAAARRVGYSVRHLERLAKQGRFPKPIKIGARAAGWLEAEIEEWLAQRIAESRQPLTGL